MADVMKFPNGILFCDLIFVRATQDWELESFYNFMDRIYGMSLRGVGDDKICWKPAIGRGFAVCFYYQVLTKSIDQSFPWKPKVPSRVAFLVWTAALGNILTIDNLRKWVILILNWCCTCKRYGESVDHLLIHCSFVSDLWSSVYLVWQSLC